MRALLLISIVLLSGCNMQRWCAQRYPPTVQTDTVLIKSVEMRDTIIYIHVPGDTITLTDTIYIDETLSTPRSHLTAKFAESFAWVDHGRLRHELYQFDQVLSDTIWNAIQRYSTQEVITVDRVHEVEVVPWWHKWVMFVMIGIILILALRR